ncbi:MAG: hypothetical protein KZQ75_10205 [Candidatus Thiodiazotropha sp. (ex Myrtea spinifera)]|nr:hypothetical protein [Candidatus Thiodiazotropha sp. (ex Myrtea spinifera)]MCU7828123.1 hypothetical protein [Candidatus Thiodiazotropha sp. (ex Myrtea sp. 'scaly one' KF741663)]
MCILLRSQLGKAVLLTVLILSVASCSTTNYKPEALLPLKESKSIYIKWAKNLPAKQYRERLYNVTKSAFINAGFEVVEDVKKTDLIVVLSGKSNDLETEFNSSHGINQKVTVITGVEVIILAVYKVPRNPNYYIIFGKHREGSAIKSLNAFINPLNPSKSKKPNLVSEELYLQATEQAFKKYKIQLNDILDIVKK